MYCCSPKVSGLPGINPARACCYSVQFYYWASAKRLDAVAVSADKMTTM